MKLILTRQVTGLGSPGDIAQVADGYGRNYLIPHGYAIRWSKGSEKQIATLRRARKAREIRDRGHALHIKDQLEPLSVTIPMRAGESGRLFGSVTAEDIVAGIHAVGGPEVDKRQIATTTPIKTVGSHQVVIQLHPEVPVTLNISVVPA